MGGGVGKLAGGWAGFSTAEDGSTVACVGCAARTVMCLVVRAAHPTRWFLLSS